MTVDVHLLNALDFKNVSGNAKDHLLSLVGFTSIVTVFNHHQLPDAL